MTQEKLQLLRQADLPYTEILEVTYEDGGSYLHMSELPPFTRVLWKNSFGEGSEIYTELWLPDDWDGLFIACGNGGMAGSIFRDVLVPHIRNRHAAVHTDMGTSRGRLHGVNNPACWADFGWRSTHMMAETGKALTELFYGQKIVYSYFIGASTGGNQAMAMVQKFPEDYDGVLAGVPAHNRIYLHTYALWSFLHLHRPDGSVMFADEEIPKITAAAVKFFNRCCGEIPFGGQPDDGFVSLPYCGEDTVERFVAFLAEEEPQFTKEQLDVLRILYEGPRNPVTGRKIYCGSPIGAESYWCGIRDNQGAEPPFFDPFVWVFGEGYTGLDFDFDADLETLTACLAADMNANSADLSAFAAHGGKLIVYSGAGDPCVPFWDTVKYCERVQKLLGGYEAASQFYRWFLMPGMDHGNGGCGVNTIWGRDEHDRDLFDSLRRWREEGIAPEYLTGARVEDGETVFARRVYPYGSERFPLFGGLPACDDYYLEK